MTGKPPQRLTLDQKQKIRRDHAAATVRQLATVLDELGKNTMDTAKRTDFKFGAIGLRMFAADIEKGKMNPRRWEFLTWIQEPKDLDSPEVSATSASKKSSG